jgi:hypothetical protein
MTEQRADGGPARAVSPIGRWVARALLVVGLLTALAGAATMIPDPGAPRAAVADARAASLADSATPADPGSQAAGGDASGPTRLTLPGLGITTSVVPVGVDDGGELAIPDNPQALGWWQDGAAPGDDRGAVVIDGHVDSYQYGTGFFVNLRRLQSGDPVVLDDKNGVRTGWTVASAALYPRDALPYDQLFSHDGPPRLVLITCGGVFDRTSRSYTDNLVVTAYPEPSQRS